MNNPFYDNMTDKELDEMEKIAPNSKECVKVIKSFPKNSSDYFYMSNLLVFYVDTCLGDSSKLPKAKSSFARVNHNTQQLEEPMAIYVVDAYDLETLYSVDWSIDAFVELGKKYEQQVEDGDVYLDLVYGSAE